MNPLESAQTELADLLAKKDEIDSKIAAIQQSIRILEPLYGRQFTGARPRSLVEDLSTDLRNLGITDAIERVLMSRPGVWMAPTIVRDHLVERGFKIAGDNPMASVHTVLKRLVDRKGPIVSGADSAKNTLYRYDPSISPHSGSQPYRSTQQPQPPPFAAELPSPSEPLGPPPPRVTADMVAAFKRGPKKAEK
jgi:hypothetical protein